MTEEEEKKKDTEIKRLIEIIKMDIVDASLSDERCPKCGDFILKGLDWKYCLTCYWYEVIE